MLVTVVLVAATAVGARVIRQGPGELDWACPGKQMHEAALEPDDPEEDFPTAEDCYPSNGG